MDEKKKALIVGIDYYEHGNPLYGCVNDAKNVRNLLAVTYPEDKPNFGCILKTASSSKEYITRNTLKDSIEELFNDKNVYTALLYFSGHGHIESSGGYLLASDSRRGDEGVPLSAILKYANQSPAKNKIIILDSCHSGIAGDAPEKEEIAILSEGLTILTASTKDQYATQENGRGIFTSLLIDALEGAAADLVGNITPGSIYAHIDQSLGVWEQRPVFKTNVKNFISLRQVPPAMSLKELRLIYKYFPTPGYEFLLNPTYEPELKGRDTGMPLPIKKNTETFAVLQKFNRLNLLVPIDAPHMWHAAMESKSCKLTPLGEHYRRLAERERI